MLSPTLTNIIKRDIYKVRLWTESSHKCIRDLSIDTWKDGYYEII
jgi:hypothetical protein